MKYVVEIVGQGYFVADDESPCATKSDAAQYDSLEIAQREAAIVQSTWDDVTARAVEA
jgi:hypothetical protein